ncbi:CaiB/BaiF CoA-transferase family protein [Nocardioides sp. LHD-245]|uniref:CaiB/BaiF CoA transferase family protein n=1 Tax=Nocardioides sp. LHD-245 TaxID=3051387 RepID=UPI0027E0B5F7|nr:CaiB/BaiF CoA-transferase family protein [Nocardioides sp. LHD-245]
MAGALDGIRVVELAGIGPGPHAAMVLADLGADVIRVERPSAPQGTGLHHTLRGRTIVRADLKDAAERAAVLDLVAVADVLIEGYRPGVAERLGLGPDACLAPNPRLVYARMTGWGQAGELAATAGHDINYISLTGVLHAVGTAEQPLPPLNLAGDYGGGSMFLVTGILAALLERTLSGRGQVVDAAMVDGAAVLVQPILELRAGGLWRDERAANILDGAAPYYRTYRCRGGGHVAVGAIEPQFYDELIELLGLPGDLPDRDDPAQWADLAEVLGTAFGRRTREEWSEVFASTDACVTPVLTFEEAARHPQVAGRGTLRHGPDGVEAAAAPRFSRSGTGAAPGRVGRIEEVTGRWSA